MNNRDPWVVLGLSRQSSDSEIKERYRQLARQFHPDRNKGDKEAAQKFQDISWAYDVLRTPDRRQSWQAESESPLDWSQEPHARGTIQISFLEAFRGTQRVTSIATDEVCQHCAGSGAAPGTAPRRCSRCSGTGQIALGNISEECSACDGRGYTIPDPCRYCSHGTSPQRREVLVHIPPGVRNGQELMISEGPRNFVFYIKVEPSPVFERNLPDPSDLLLHVPVSFSEALLGAAVRIPTPERVVEMQVPAGSSSGRTLRISGAGMPRDDGSRGDLYARIEIDVPDDPPPALRRLAEQIAEEERGEEMRARLFKF